MSHHDHSQSLSNDALTPVNTVLADPFEFARAGGELAVTARLASFSRVMELAQADGAHLPVQYRISGEQQLNTRLGEHAKAQSFLNLQFNAQVALVCQRCLQSVVCTVETENRLWLVPEDEDLPEEELEESAFDAIHAGRNLDVLALVEDELLLCLPLVPMHETCSLPGAENPAKPVSAFGASLSAALQKVKK